MYRRLIVLLLLSSSIALADNSIPVAPNRKPPAPKTVAHNSGSNDPWRTVKASEGGMDCPPDHGDTYELKADFDGNGKLDVARFQLNTKNKHRRVAVWMNGDSKPRVFVDDGFDKAGSFLTLVEKGEMLNSVEDPEVNVKLTHPGIGYGGCQSSEVVYYWDDRARDWKSVWTSD